MLLRGLRIFAGPVPPRETRTKPQRRFGRRVFDSDEEGEVAPAGFRAAVAERPVAEQPSTGSTSQLLEDAFDGRKSRGWGLHDGGSPIELSSDSEDDCGDQPSRRPWLNPKFLSLLDHPSELERLPRWGLGMDEPEPSTSQPPSQYYTPRARPPQSSNGTSAPPPDTPVTAAAFRKQRAALVAELLSEYNDRVFDGVLPSDLQVTWNVHLKTTAGLTHYKREPPPRGHVTPIYIARVELSSKVVDTPYRLRATLLHELCHVAAWLVDHTAKPPHGKEFQRWADRAKRCYPDLEIAVCHSYDIYYPFRWQCTNPECARVVKRHSKSIDTTKKVCGACKGTLAFLGRFNQDGTPAKQREPSQFSLFVKDNFGAVKQSLPPGSPHSAVMQGLSSMWKEAGRGRGRGASRGPMTELHF